MKIRENRSFAKTVYDARFSGFERFNFSSNDGAPPGGATVAPPVSLAGKFNRSYLENYGLYENSSKTHFVRFLAGHTTLPIFVANLTLYLS